MKTIDINKKSRTRDGREVRIYATDAGGKYPVHVAMKINTEWVPFNWKEDGNGVAARGNDLIEVKEKIVRWVNVYPTGECYAYPSKEIATPARADCVACIRIEYEEGEGL